MSLHFNKDTLALKVVTIADLVEMCSDCARMCMEKTARIMDNRSRAPRGWDALFKSVAEERRLEDYTLCEEKCTLVNHSCPESEVVRRFEGLDAKAREKLPAKEKAELPSIQQTSRCEHAVEDFSALLFLLAHKPSKVTFEKVDPRTGQKAAEGEEQGEAGAPTEVHKKVLRGAGNLDDEIMRRWSSARRDRLNMEDQGFLRSSEEVLDFKQKLRKEAAQNTSGGNDVGGTTPKW